MRRTVIQGRAEDYTVFPSDLLVANIHYDVMKKIVRSPGFLHQKWFLLSGLLRSEAKEMADFLSRQPVIIVKQWNQDGTRGNVEIVKRVHQATVHRLVEG